MALLVVWDFMADYTKKAAILHTVSKECSDLESKWRALWRDVNREDADDVEIRNQIEQLALPCPHIWCGTNVTVCHVTRCFSVPGLRRQRQIECQVGR